MHFFSLLLEKSERYARTDIRYVAHGGFWLLLNQGAMFLFSLLLLWVFTNLLSKEIYGEYRFITTVASLLAIAALPGMGIALTRAVAQHKSGVIFSIIKEKIRFGGVGTVIALAGAIYYYWNDDPRLTILFFIVALAVPFVDTFTSYQHYLNGLKDFKLYAMLRTGQRAFTVFATTGAIIFSGDIIIIVTIFFSSSIISDFAALMIAKATYPSAPKKDEAVLAYGKHLSIMSAMRLGAQYLDKVSLWYFSGPVAVASYAVAVAMPQELTTGCAQIGKLALPKMSTRSKDELRNSLLRKTFLYAIITTPITLAYIAFSPLLFQIFFPQYVDVVFFSQIAALVVIFAANSLFVQYFYATENKKALYIQNVTEPTALLILYALLIPTLGILGAIIATLARHVLMTGIWLVLFISDRSS
jgi:O-antigen/teichoic acid export membrane protein